MAPVMDETLSTHMNKITLSSGSKVGGKIVVVQINYTLLSTLLSGIAKAGWKLTLIQTCSHTKFSEHRVVW